MSIDIIILLIVIVIELSVLGFVWFLMSRLQRNLERSQREYWDGMRFDQCEYWKARREERNK